LIINGLSKIILFKNRNMKKYYLIVGSLVLLLSACETSKRSTTSTAKSPAPITETTQAPPAEDKTENKNNTEELKTPQQNTSARKRPYIPAERGTQQKLIAVDSIP
jgi:hypothetical protein